MRNEKIIFFMIKYIFKIQSKLDVIENKKKEAPVESLFK